MKGPDPCCPGLVASPSNGGGIGEVPMPQGCAAETRPLDESYGGRSGLVLKRLRTWLRSDARARAARHLNGFPRAALQVPNDQVQLEGQDGKLRRRSSDEPVE